MRTSLSGIGRLLRRPVLISLAALFWPAGLFAQASGPIKLDADRAVEMAFAANLSLQSAQIDVDAKKRKVDTSWNVFIPTVDVNGTLGRWNVEKSAAGIVSSTFSGVLPASNPSVYAYSYSLPDWVMSGSLQAQLVLNAALFEGMKNLKLDYSAGRLTLEQARVKLERDVRKSYYSILLLKENIALMEDNLAAAERRVEQAQDNYRAGLAPELTVLQARVAAANLKPALEELRNGLDASLAGFAMNLGLPRGSKLELAPAPQPEFVDLDEDKLLERGKAENLNLKSLDLSILSLESARKLSLYRYYTPSLILGWTFDPAFAGDPWKDNWFGEDMWKQSSGMFRATLSFNLDGLLPFSKNALSLTDMDESKRKLGIARALTERGMETEVDSLVQKLEKSRDSVDALALNVELADRAYKLSEDAYKAGAKDLLDVQNADLELRKARLEVLKEKFTYVTGLIDLEYAIGVPFGSLARKAK